MANSMILTKAGNALIAADVGGTKNLTFATVKVGSGSLAEADRATAQDLKAAEWTGTPGSVTVDEQMVTVTVRVPESTGG